MTSNDLIGQETRQHKHEKWMEDYYKKYSHKLSDIRCALGDAAGMCDAMAQDILDAVKPRTKLKMREAQAISDGVKKAGDALWAMRERIKHNQPEGSGK